MDWVVALAIVAIAASTGWLWFVLLLRRSIYTAGFTAGYEKGARDQLAQDQANAAAFNASQRQMYIGHLSGKPGDVKLHPATEERLKRFETAIKRALDEAEANKKRSAN